MSDVRIVDWDRFGETSLEPLAGILTLSMTVLAVRAKRSAAILPILVVATMISHTQRVVIFDLDFSMQRVVVLAVLARMVATGELRSLRWRRIDTVVSTWVTLLIVVGIIGSPSFSTFVNRLGYAIDGMGMYVVARSSVRTQQDLVETLRAFAWVLIPISIFMVYESITSQNLFRFTGAPEIPIIREGKLRCQGALGHPILAGSFGAAGVPLMIGLVLSDPKSRVLGLLAIVSGIIITLTTASSGPAICLVAGLGAWFIWPVRRWTKIFLYGSVVLIFVTHLIMKQPVWHLIGRLSALTGGTGYHRVRLIDAAVYNFGEWWLIGSKNSMYWGWGLQDTTNWYIANGLQGGVITLIAFIATLVLAFRAVRDARIKSHAMKKRGMPEAKVLEYLAWGLGASLFSHCVAWVSVSYFGTMQLIFFLQLALYSALRAKVRGQKSGSKGGEEDSKPPSQEQVARPENELTNRPGLSGLLYPRN